MFSLTFVSCITCMTSFDFQMLCANYNMFAMVISFINKFWEPTHVIVGVFEMQNIISVTITNQVKEITDSFGLLYKVIAFVKAKGSNLNSLINVLKFVVFCSPLQLPTPFARSCFNCAMLKATQYANNDAKVCQGFSKINLKATEISIQKASTWIKKSRKGRTKWKNVCIIARLPIRIFKKIMKMQFASKIIFF